MIECGRSSTVSAASVAKEITCSITFCSSRTLPGHGYCCRISIASGATVQELPARVAEQLGLEQRLRQPRAVDRDERRVRARRTRVNVACDHVLAHAALARDQNLAVSRGNFRRGGQDRHHAWGAGDEEGLGDVLAARRRIHGSGLRPITATCGARDVAGGSNTLAGIAIGVPHRRSVRTVNGSAHGTYLLNSRGDSRSSITPRA